MRTIKVLRKRIAAFVASTYELLRYLRDRAWAVLMWKFPEEKYDNFGMRTQAILILCFWGFMEIRPVYTGHPLATGYAIAALALAAVVMAGRGPDLKPWETTVWITVCAFLFIGEMRLIDQDREQQDRQHLIDISTQNDAFVKTLKKLTDLNTLSANQFSETMKRFSEEGSKNQSQFAATMREFSRNDHENQENFKALIAKDEALFEHENKLAASLNGSLEAGSEPTPPNICGTVSADSVLVFLGDEKKSIVSVVDVFPSVVLAMRKDAPKSALAELGVGGGLSASDIPMFSLSRSSDGKVNVILDMRSQDGRIIVRMNQKGFVINRNNYLEMTNDDKSALTITDEFGQDVLKVHYLNAHAINVSGTALEIGQGMQNYCSEYSGPIILNTRPR